MHVKVFKTLEFPWDRPYPKLSYNTDKLRLLFMLKYEVLISSSGYQRIKSQAVSDFGGLSKQMMNTYP